jgi:hypothetical protein
VSTRSERRDADTDHRGILSGLLWQLRCYVGAELHKRRYRNFRPICSNDAVVSGIENQVAYLATILRRGDIDKFLRRLSELSAKLIGEPLVGRALFVPELDELARKASLMVAPSNSRTKDSKLLVHVASVVHPIGGHSRVIEDIAAALPEFRHVLIITDMAQLAPMELAPLVPRFQKLRLETYLLKASTWADKARELSSLVGAFAPQAVLLLSHYADSIAFVGVAGHAAPKVVFLHQCDHMPALGACRADYTHIDLTPSCHRFCASRPEMRASLVNLTAVDIGTVRLDDCRPIFGVTCASPHKYEGSSEFSYGQLLAALFSAGVDRILHIGEMPNSQKQQIRAEITERGEDKGRVVFLPNTPSLPEKLIEISPDFYLTSHPVGGGKATVEAMSVGLPIMYVCPASTPPLFNSDMTYATSIPISTLQQAPAAVRRLQTEKNSLAKRSRAIYEKYYSPAAFREGLLSAISGIGTETKNLFGNASTACSNMTQTSNQPRTPR